MITVKAIVKAGHQVASGNSDKDKRFPEGTIKMQEPFFKELGFDLTNYFDGNFIYGTLNLSVAPCGFKIIKPEYYMENVKWTDLQPAENFFLSPAQIQHNGASYKALIYIPDPSTKPNHFQAPSIIEVISEPIESLNYEEKVDLCYNQEAIKIASFDA